MRFRRGLGAAAAVGLGILASGCATGLLDGFRGDPVVERRVAASPEEVWQRIEAGLFELDVAVSEVHAGRQHLQLAWITTPGDGAAYLDCPGKTIVGSASLHPRITVAAAAGGSRVIVASEARGTTTAECASTGAYERLLLERLGLSGDAPVAVSPVARTPAGRNEP